MVDILQRFYESLKLLRSDINRVATSHVAKAELKHRAKNWPKNGLLTFRQD